MKILLINPPRFDKNPMIREIRCAGLSPISVYPPIELAYLAGVLRKDNEVEILDANGLNQNFEDIKRKINKFKPEAVVFTTSPASFNYDAQIAQITKKINKEIKTFLLDSHIVPVMPKKIKENFPEIDYLVGKEPLLNIPKLLGFKGMADLENHPLPAYDLLPLNQYSSFTFSRKKPFATLITSVGCPYKCNFCVIGGATVDRGYGSGWKFKSPEKILKEIKYLLNKGVKSIFFFDETFTVLKQRVIDLCQMIKNEKLKFEWSCNGRIDTLDDEELIKLMKETGCWNILFGIESGSEKLLEKANKSSIIPKAERVIGYCKKNGIETSASFMLGFPEEDKKTIKETLKIAKRINPHMAQFVIVTPYPGTKLYQEIKEKGLLEEDYSFSGYDAYCVDCRPVIRTENLSAEELLAAQKFLYRKFYLRPSFLIKKILEIKSFSQFLNILKSVRYLK
jgi:radical SAM superfamily enzyme YgiQ (UPF0313 family)